MKNFTKQITNKTLFKPTRWIIMALMLLLGTGSAWATVYVVGNAFESWSTFTPMKETNGKHYYPILHPVKGNQFKLSTKTGWDGEVKGLAGSTSDTRFTFGSNNNNHTINLNVTNGLLAYDPSGGNGNGWIWTEDYSICVAGASGLTGDNWSTTADPMTYSNGVWSVKFSGVNAGTYQFKVVAGNYLWETTSYDNSKGDLDCSVVDGNISITTPSKGDVTIYFDGEVYVTYKASCTTPDAPTIKINNGTSAKLCSGSATITTTEVVGATAYKLYKDDSSTASQTNETGTFTVSEADTYYVTVTTCEESPKQTTGVTLEYYSAPTLENKYSITNATKCNDNITKGSVTISNAVTGVTYYLDDNAGTSWTNLSNDDYTLKATLDACSNLSNETSVSVGLTDNTPTATVSIADVEPICTGESTTLTCNVTPTKGTVSSYTWTLPDKSTQVTNTNTLSTGAIEQAGTYNYSVVVTLENNGCVKESDPASKTVTVNSRPEIPNFGQNNSETVCQNTEVALPSTINEVELKWYDSEDRTNEVTSFTANEQKTFYAAAYNGTCESEGLASYTYKIYPVPTISIKIRDLNVSTLEVMCHELVTLYATTENTVDGALVYWYKDGVQITENGQPVTGDSYTFTSTTATTFSNISAKVQNGTSCDAVESNKVSVTFEAHEVCPPSYKQGKILYFRPNGSWKEASARFAAYFYGNGNTWIDMTDGDNDGTYACEIPAGYPNVIFCRMNPSGANNWDNKWAQTGDLTIPTDSKRVYSFNNINNDWYPTDGAWSNLGSDQTFFRTIAVNGNGLWNTGGASVYAHPWSISDQSQGWFCMTPGIEAGIWLIDIETKYTDIVFERRDASGNQYDGGAAKHKTADLKLDIYGNEFVIEKYEGEGNAHGNWHWKWFEDNYDLGVQTNIVQQNGTNLEIHCTGVIYKTNCAPGIKYGFEYSTNQDMTDATYVECGQGYIEVGSEYVKNIPVDAGTYYVCARAQYEDGTIYYGSIKPVTIANNCDPDYEFAVGGTSVVVQACGGNRVLPAIEIISDKTPAGNTVTWSYEWTNEDGSTATNLSPNNIASPTFNGTASQTYKLRVFKTVGGEIKCTQTATYQVAYDNNSPKAVITAATEVEIYEQLILQGEAHYTESFTWKVTENEVDVTSTMLSDASTLNPTFNTKEAGTYVVTLTAAKNQDCDAHTATTTITVSAPAEDCASGGIEIAVDLDKQGNFNTGNDVFIFDDCNYVTKLYKENTYVFTEEYIAENGYPNVMIASQQVYDNYYAYMKVTQLSEEHLGKKVTFGFNNAAYQNQNSAICTYDGKNYNREYYDISITIGNISTSTSAPTITTPNATVEGTAPQATLSAYFAATGCASITKYGFQYISSDTEPTDWSDATEINLGTSPTIGKTFTATTADNLTEGKWWFRAYASNDADKTGYTAVTSFDIITDGPYPVFDDNNVALSLNAENKVVVKIKNQGNEDLLKGSYLLTIVDQNLTMTFTPALSNTGIVSGASQTFTSSSAVTNINHYNITATLTYKGRKDTRNISQCTPIKAAQDLDGNGLRDTIYYTIDAAAVTDKCLLVFPTVYEAIDHLKYSCNDTDEDYHYTKKIGNGYILQQPVVMQVAYSTNRYKGNISVNTTGGGDKANALIIPIININNDDDDGDTDYNVDKKDGVDVTDKYYSLTIRALNENAMPTLQHIAIRDSRYITLDKLNIVASDDTKDNAIDIDCNNNSWVGNDQAKFKNTYVNIKNCNIKSKGFTCVHVSAVDKVHFLNNEITADLDNSDIEDDNVRCWGASVKFIRSNNLSFIRNNFMGTHATSIWLQEVDGALFMNNVLWNNNKIEQDIFCMFRIVQQTGNYYPANIGIYYNTLYLADNSASRSNHPKFNFLTLNSNDNSTMDDAIAHNGDFDFETIEFMYNNCYSYDTKTPGRPDVPFKYEHNTNNGTPRTAWAGLCNNNFWSVYDNSKENSTSAFAFSGCDNGAKFINVKDNVCTTTASSPNSLVISGEELNLGVKPTTALAQSLGANLLYSDRNRSGVRPKDGQEWTLGAYQQTDPIATQTIIWQGSVSNEWDDRNNWIDKATGNVLTCVNELAEDLKVIIPAPHSEKYPTPGETGIVNYPKLPEFDSRDDKFGEEIVNAGQGVYGVTPTMFADVIELEYGGSLQGVERLEGNARYNEVNTELIAGRSHWILVGNMVKPFTSDAKDDTRLAISEDYFFTNQAPRTYMRQVKLENNTPTWQEEFPNLDMPIQELEAFAIILPNQYGPYKKPDYRYYAGNAEMINDGVVAKSIPFNGRFINDSQLSSFTGLTANTPVMVNNTYPCNLNADAIEDKGYTVVLYNYETCTFDNILPDAGTVIKPQHGFVITNNGSAAETLTIDHDLLAGGSTKYNDKSAEATMPYHIVRLYNANSTNGYASTIQVFYDNEKGTDEADARNTEKFWSNSENSMVPDLYMLMYDKTLQRMYVNKGEITIPLGVRLQQDMDVYFKMYQTSGYEKATLTDVLTNKEYDLTGNKEAVITGLTQGNTEGRFFLNLVAENSTDSEGSTTVIDANISNASINIYTSNNNSISVVANEVELQTIYISDMIGRTVQYKASGNYAKIPVPMGDGIYIIKVIGDNAVRSEKVILK